MRRARHPTLFAAAVAPRVGIGIVALLGASLTLADTRPLTFAERVLYQRRIERIRYTHRLESVPGPHPSFEKSVPVTLIRERVETYLLQGEALARHLGRPLSGAQLQAEVTRMARSTRSPERLAELFRALDDDPYVIAECLARPLLTERLLRHGYAYGDRFHGGLRAQAEAALAASHGSLDALRTLAPAYVEELWERAEEEGEDDAQWNGTVGRLERELALPLERPGPLGEDAERFFVHAILEQSDTRLRVATLSWNKTSFDSWWTTVRAELLRETGTIDDASPFGALAPGDGGYRVTPTAGQACVPDTWIPTTVVVAAPVPAASHQAVWTGTEMIVWGGSKGGGAASYVNTGSRYDPATDTWTPTSTGAGVPAARAFHTAVWTGTEMIVWGGQGASGDALDSGGRYDPLTDSWGVTNLGPQARMSHRAVWTGSEMIVWGGGYFVPNRFVAINTGGRYDPTADTWVATSTVNAPPARFGHVMVWTGTETIVWGGASGGTDTDPPTFLASGGRYDARTDSWTATSESGVPAGRTGAGAVWTGTEMIAWGGSCCGDPQGVPPTTFFDDGGRYDPRTDVWVATSTAPGVPAARAGHTAVWTGTEMIVWGGNGPGGDDEPFDTGGRYDPATDGWAATSIGVDVPSARGGHSAVWTGEEMIVWGGRDGDELPLNTGGRYDPALDTWVGTDAVDDVPDKRSSHTAVWTGTEMIVWGGGVNGLTNSGTRYDPATGTWTPTSTAPGVPAGRSRHTAIWTGTEMIVWGGRASGCNYLNSGARYDPLRDAWSPTGTGGGLPAARADHTAVWSGTEMIVWGGFSVVCSPFASTLFNSGARYDPVTDGWTATSVGSGVPTARSRHTAVWSGTEMIVWGGGNGTDSSPSTVFNTGARYDPAADAWAPTGSGAGVPHGAERAVSIWTGTEMIVWGGKGPGSTSYVDTGGRYDPAADLWKPTSTGAGVPSPRQQATAVWTGAEMIVWGGQGTLAPFLNTGGRYAPATDLWTPTSTGADVPSPRNLHTAIWTGTEMIVWGGSVGTGSNTNTGGRYCACASATWYLDADGDGHGDPATALSSCAPPGGNYVARGDDCDDGSASVSPEAAEVCNGADDDCNLTVDDPPAPAFVTALAADKTDTSASFDWSVVATATGYDVVKGGLSTLLSSAGDFAVATSACLANDVAAGPVDDAELPPVEDGFWYLVRALNCGGVGSYDSGGEGQVAPRDAAIALSPSACP